MEIFHKYNILNLLSKINSCQLEEPNLQYATIVLCQKLLEIEEFKKAEFYFNTFLSNFKTDIEKINNDISEIQDKLNERSFSINIEDELNDKIWYNEYLTEEDYLFNSIEENDTPIFQINLTKEELKENYLNVKTKLLFNLLKEKFNIYIKIQEHFLEVNKTELFDKKTYIGIKYVKKNLNSIVKKNITIIKFNSSVKSVLNSNESTVFQLQSYNTKLKEEIDPILSVDKDFSEQIQKSEFECSMLFKKLDESFKIEINKFK